MNGTHFSNNGLVRINRKKSPSKIFGDERLQQLYHNPYSL